MKHWASSRKGGLLLCSTPFQPTGVARFRIKTVKKKKEILTHSIVFSRSYGTVAKTTQSLDSLLAY